MTSFRFALLLIPFACICAFAQSSNSCPDTLYELQHRSWLQPYVQASSTAVQTQFSVAPAAGTLSIAQWVSLTPQQGKSAQSTIFHVSQGLPGQAPYGDSFRLFWDDKNSRITFQLINNATANLPPAGSNSTAGLEMYSVVTTLVDSGVIELNSNQYRLVSLQMDAATGVVSVAIDGVFVIMSTVPELVMYGVVLTGNATVTLNADMDGANILTGMTADVIVSVGPTFTAADLQYLSQFRYPLASLPAGGCGAKPANPLIDPSCPLGPLEVYFFTRSGWSFPDSRVIDNWGGFASWNIGASQLSLAPRSVLAGLSSLTNVSWTPLQESQASCGLVQSAVLVLNTLAPQQITLTFNWNSPPTTNDNFVISDGATMVSVTSFQAGAISSSKSFTFTYQPVDGVFNLTISSPSFTVYCLSNIVALGIGAVIADPRAVYSGVNSVISIYAGVGLSDGVAFVSYGTRCSSVLTSDLLSPVKANPVSDNNFTTFLMVAVPAQISSGSYSLCVFPNGILGPTGYVSSQCGSSDKSGTYMCQLDVAYLPGGAIPLARGWVHSLLKLGDTYFGGIQHGLFNVDYFAPIGGQANMQPQIGDMFNTSLGTFVWTPLQSPTGLFGMADPNNVSPFEVVQYFSIAVFSGVSQTISLSVKFANGVMIFIDGTNVFQEYLGSNDLPQSDITIYHSDPILLSQGWHQVNIKLWAPPASTTSVFALRFDQAQQLSWSFEMPGGGGASGNYTSICATAETAVPCVASDPDLNHEECVALGCCYFNTTTTAGNPHCSASSGGLVPYRTDARCGVGFPAANLNVSQCNPRSSTGSTCCSQWNWCGSGSLYCDCPTCADYKYLNQPRCSYSLWGTKARCLGSNYTDAGYVSFATCAQSCDADANCAAFTLSAPSYGACRLYTECGTTVVSSNAAVLYRKNCGTLDVPCALVEQTDMRCGDTFSNLVSVGATSVADCFNLCKVSTRCAGVQYNSNSSTCFFLQRNCSTPLTPSVGSTVAFYRCPGDGIPAPTPLPHPPNTTTYSLVGCFPDTKGGFLSLPSYAWVGLAQKYYSSNYNNFSAAEMSVDYCRSYCEPLGARYFAITNGTICTCGVRYDSIATTAAQCSTPCPANSSQICGGPAAASVFLLSLAQGPCIDGYSLFQGNCYKYVSDPGMSSWLSWTNARAACAADGGSLASMHSPAESQFMLSFSFTTIPDPLDPSPGQRRMAWSGGMQSRSSVTWEWVDGSNFDFSDWRSGEPNNGANTGTNEGCLAVFSNYGTPFKGSWNDGDCSMPLPYICKINLNHSLSYPRLYLAQSESTNLCVSSGYLPQLLQDLQLFNPFDLSLADRSPNFYSWSLLVNGVSSTSRNYTAGVRRSALSLTGGSYLVSTTNWDVPRDFISIAVWVRPSAAPTTSQIIVSKSYRQDDANVSSPQFCWGIAYDTTGSNLCFHVGYSSVCTAAPSFWNWFHVAGTYDGVTISLFVNGSLRAYTSVSPSMNSSYAPLLRSTLNPSVGYRSSTPWDATRVFSGSLDELRIYRSVLEPTQVLYLAACSPSSSQFSIINVYEGTAPQIILQGGGFTPSQALVLAQGYCQVGSSAQYTPTVLSVTADPSSAVWTPAASEMYPPVSNDTWISYYLQLYSICYANQADRMFIGADTNLQLAVVHVDSIADSYDTFNASQNQFPLTVQVAGSNLRSGQILVTAADPGCNQVEQILPLFSASYNGSSASVTINAPSVISGANYFCWGASADAAVSSANLHPTGINLFVYTASTQVVRLAIVDGTTPIDDSAIRRGFYATQDNFFTACTTLNSMGDAFFITLTMGQFVDYFLPLAGNSVCDTLLGVNFFTMWMRSPYTYSPVSPLDPSFDGTSQFVPYNWMFGQLGGSPRGFVDDGRDQLSVWGSRYNSDQMGGCCFSKAGQESEWFQPYTLVVASVNKTNRYLALTLAPTIAVINESLLLQAQVLDTFSTVVSQNCSFLIAFQATSGGVILQWTVSNSSGQLDFVTVLPQAMSIYTAFVINVTVINVDNVQFTNSRTTEVSIISSSAPSGFTSNDPTQNLPTYLHFGSLSTGIPVAYYYLGIYTDWFYKYGGEPFYQPRLNDVATASDDSFFSFSEPTNVTATWTSVTMPNGVFAGTIANNTIQFFALAIYSPVDQSIQMEYSVSSAIRCYLDSAHFIFEFSAVNNSKTELTPISEGYHQLFCKVYAGQYSTSLLSMRLIGAALAWGLNMPLGLPEGTVPLTANATLTDLLHLGTASSYISGDFFTKYIAENTIMPDAGQLSYGLTWTTVSSVTGSWIIDASNVSGRFNDAISYFAFGLYSLSDASVTFQMTATDLGVVFLDGAETEYFYEAGSLETFTLDLTPGWHQVLLKLGVYPSSGALPFSITPIAVNGIVAYAVQTGSKLPTGANPLADGGLITSLLQLFSNDYYADSTSHDKVPYDPNSTLAMANSSDIDVTAIITDADNVTINVLNSGSLREFGWFAMDSDDGIFGSAGMGGSFNSYFAFAVYAVADMPAASFTVNFQHGFAFWLDGALVSSSDTPIPGGRSKSFSLTQGWHQIVLKLKAAADFYLTSVPNTTTWAAASTICHKFNYLQMCTAAAVCPYGIPRPGYFPDPEAGSCYIPTRDEQNMWIQAGKNGDTATCTRNYDPSWGASSAAFAGRHEIGCCGGLEKPYISFSIAADPSASNSELGWAYEIPEQFVEQPVITIANPKSATQTVTITCANAKATIYYTLDYSEPTAESSKYTEPFDVTSSLLITAVCYLDTKSESQYSYDYVYVPSTPYLTRSGCVAGARCFSDVYGVETGALMTFVLTSSPNISQFLSQSFAASVIVSSVFPGVLRVSNNNSLIIPALTAGVYTPIVYDGYGEGTALDQSLSFKLLTLSPSSVVAVNGVILAVSGGVSYGDSFIFLDPLYGSAALDSSQCTNAACGRAFANNRASIQYYTGSTVQVDLLGYYGTLSCLCFAATGEADTEQAPADIMSRIAAPVSISVRVIPPTNTTDTYGMITPQIVMDSQTLSFAFGTFTDLQIGSYRVVFSPVMGTTSWLNTTVYPSCQVDSVNSTTVTCSIFARPGVSGLWNVSLQQDGNTLNVLPGTQTLITAVPPQPVINVATGPCVTVSSDCVTNTLITFIGNSFDAANPDNNNIFFEPGTITCTTQSATVSSLVCRLYAPQDVAGEFKVLLHLAVSPSFFYTVNTGQSLLLGGGNAPGWSGNAATDAPGTGASPGKSGNVAGVVAGVFGAALAVIGIVVLVVNRKYALVPKAKQSEEMDAIEQQLNGVGDRPREGGLEVHVPPIPNAELQGSVNNV
jgi:hypothetical protein